MNPLPAPKDPEISEEKEVLEAMNHYFSRDKEALKRQIERLVEVIHKAQG